MKIGFTGTQGTGKSTLVDLMFDDFGNKMNYKRHTNASRILKTNLDNFKINKETNIITQSSIAGVMSIDMLREERIITDRTIIDVLAYTMSSAKDGNIQFKDFEEFEETFIPLVERYDLIFYIPIEFETEEDGVRDTDVEYRKKIDEYITHFLSKYNIKYITLTGTIEERIEKVFETIDNY